MAVHCIVPPHPAALFVTNELGADMGTVIVAGLAVGLVASLVGGPLFLKVLGERLPFKPYLKNSQIWKFVKKKICLH